MKTIDVHAHFMPRSAVRAFEEGRDWYGTTISRLPNGMPGMVTGGRKGSLGSLEYWWAVPDRLPLLAEERIDFQLISLSPQMFRDQLPAAVAIECNRAVNDELAETVADHPDRFAALAVLPVQDTGAAVAELERAMTTLGMKGVLIGSHVNGLNWDDETVFPILEAADRLGAFVLLHPFNSRNREPFPRFHMVNLIGNPLETTIAAGSLILGGVLDRLPNLTICLAHAGGYLPAAIGRFDHGYTSREEVRQKAERLPSEYLRRFHYDIISHSETGLRELIELVGADRVLLGTDFPADMAQRRPVDWLEGQKHLSREDFEAICGGNAARLGLVDTVAA